MPQHLVTKLVDGRVDNGRQMPTAGRGRLTSPIQVFRDSAWLYVVRNHTKPFNDLLNFKSLQGQQRYSRPRLADERRRSRSKVTQQF